jgi:hypothetical protein
MIYFSYGWYLLSYIKFVILIIIVLFFLIISISLINSSLLIGDQLVFELICAHELLYLFRGCLGFGGVMVFILVIF